MRRSDDKANTPNIYRRWSGRTRGGVWGNWFFYFSLRTFGLRAAYAIMFPVVAYFLLTSPKGVRASNAYLRRIGYGGSSALSRLWGTYKHFLSFGKVLLDRVVIIDPKAPKFKFTFDGEEHLHAALNQGKGLILISAHCGNWEAAAHMLGQLEVPVNIVAYEGDVARIRKFMDRALKDRFFSIIVADGKADSSLAIIAALNRGEIVAIHGDRCFREEGASVPFLGGRARFPTGPFTVAAFSGAPLIFAFAMREAMRRYSFYAYPPEYLSDNTGLNRRQLIEKWMSSYVEHLEKILRAYPLQWHNFYNFWEDDVAQQQG